MFCCGEKKTPLESETTRLPHDLQEARTRIWRKREQEAEKRKDVELKQRKKFKDGVIRANLANEFELTVYPFGFVRRPIITTQEDDVAWEPVNTTTASSSTATSSANASEQRAVGESIDE